MPTDLTGIHNVGEFYSHHYLEAVLGSDLKEVFDGWKQREADEGTVNPARAFARLSGEFFKAKHQASQEADPLERWRLARDFHVRLLEVLGYRYQPEVEVLPSGEEVPLVLQHHRDGRPFLWVCDAPFPAEADESALDTAPLPQQYPTTTDDHQPTKQPPTPTPPPTSTQPQTPSRRPQDDWRELLDGPLFKQEHPPRWVIFLGGDDVLLIDRHKWGQGKYLRFELADLFSRQNKDALRATTALLHREVLDPEGGVSRHDTLDEKNHKHAYAVSADLKYGARQAIELLGNEAIRYKREISKEAVFSNTQLAAQVTDECLTYLYRLLFLFYVEARGPQLGVSPMNADAFRQGYSLETLRDLELVPLTTEKAQNGYYLHHSLERLFDLMQHGFPRKTQRNEISGQLELGEADEVRHHGFYLRGLFCPLFDPDRTPMLRGVKFRNCVLQEVLQLLSLSKEGKNKTRGRISYAQLGINQLGSVYEGLLSYSGFFAHDTLYEVRSAKEIDDGEARTFFVPVTEVGVFDEGEIVKDENGRKLRHEKGSYLFRLSGREREKSASYYTPEVLTQCLVKYTLKERLEGLAADEILQLTLCEPAMGSGAFLIETVNQLAHAYLEAKQKETGLTIASDQYPAEWQKVKAHFTCHRCYGVDKNPRALELAKLSLWLNSLSDRLETPYLDLRLATGDSLIGARRCAYKRGLLTKKATKAKPNWLGTAPESLPKWEPGWVYHFLLPYDGMADFEKDKAVKALLPEAMQTMKDWRKESTLPFTEMDCETLERLSARIDDLWQKHAAERETAARLTRHAIDLWGQEPATGSSPTVADSHAHAAQLRRGTSPGARLKAVMDYWCALWYWPLEQAELLPSRDEWFMEVDALLDNDAEALMESFPRFQVIKQITERVRFVHWELAFAEVFAHRGGFDIVVGNPPWVKVEWQEAGVLGDIAPELVVKKISASDVARRREEVLKGEDERGLYLGEFQEITGTANFLGSAANMPLLVGQKNNLYKCFLVFNWHLLNREGMQGLVHQPGVFDDPYGGMLRSELSGRLVTLLSFTNYLNLFEGVLHKIPYCVTITRGQTLSVRFLLCSNLFHPQTLDSSIVHDGFGSPPGIKNDDDDWELRGHRSRIVEIDEEALALFAKLYDSPDTPALEARIPVVHSREILSVLRKLSQVDRRLGDLGDEYFATQCLNETLQQKDGTMRRETRFPADVAEWIVSGPHFYVGTPFNKTPREECNHNSEYDIIDHTAIPNDYLPRTNFVPSCDAVQFASRTPHWKGRKFSDWYRHVNRRMVAPTGERTYVNCIIPPGANHIDLAFSITFDKSTDLVRFSGLGSSIVVDFYVKSTGKGDARGDLNSILPLPSQIENDEKIAARTLRLNCLTTHYADLWTECWDPAFAKDGFTKDDPRLGSWSHLTPEWHRHCAVRTAFERRQCLVELDALAALALGLTAEELCTIYRVQFPVLRSYEKETFYDQRGHIVFTTNRGLTGVGLDRKQWEEIKHAQPDHPLPDFAQPYPPPYTRCDREQDMTQAYEVFQERQEKEAHSQ